MVVGYNSRSNKKSPENKARKLFKSIENDFQQNNFRCHEIEPIIQSLHGSPKLQKRGRDLLKKCLEKQREYNESNASRGPNGIIIGLAILAILLVLGVGAMVYFNTNDTNNQNQQIKGVSNSYQNFLTSV